MSAPTAFSAVRAYGNSTSHRIEMMDHVLMADVMDLDASAFERVSICLPFVAQEVETCGVDMGGRQSRKVDARRGDKRWSFTSKSDGR
jgi:hypothetical protein